jgi:hypothetical protein
VKSTKALRILCSSRLPEGRMNLHPNEGADMGLMTTQHSAVTAEGSSLELHLLNECPKESVEISSKLWERLGKPAKVVLEYDKGTLKIDPVR